MTATSPQKVVALSGGIGGAKLALGLSRVVAPEHLTIIANTGDDFEHLGLSISPDIDTLKYTLAGLANTELGWGRGDETWNFMAALRDIGGEDWFNLGDRDLAIHVERTRRLAAGERLTIITQGIARALGVGPTILPMSDSPVRTYVESDQGRLPFQDYFVRLKCAPVVSALQFEGADNARLSHEIGTALSDPDLSAVIICPSNPLISIDPILAIPGMRNAIANCKAPVVAISPIVAGKALKGPTAKMLDELGFGATAAVVADRYRDLLSAYIVEADDYDDCLQAGFPFVVEAARTIMTSLEDREDLARTVLATADRIRNGEASTARASG